MLKLMLFTSFWLFAVQNSSFNPLSEKKAAMVLENTVHDFGRISQGVPVEKEFYFTNKGEAPLVITKVTTSCGCTATDWPEEAVMPGERSSLKVKYNAAKTGGFHKSVRIFSNASEEPLVLYIKGEVSE